MGMESYQGRTTNYEEEEMRYAPLLEAVGWGNLEAVEAILQGSSPTDVDGPYHRHMYRYAEKNALYVASERGDVAIVKALLQAGANVHVRYCSNRLWKNSGWMVLHTACYHC